MSRKSKNFKIFALLIVIILVIIDIGTVTYSINNIQESNTIKDISQVLIFNQEHAPIPDFHKAPTPPPLPPDNNNFDKDYDYPPVAQSKGTVRIPVLTYHHIAPLPNKGSARDYYVSPEMFDKQMAYLKAKNYATLSMEEFYNQLKSGQNPTQKSILITFDDSNKNNYTNAFPILQKYGFKATFFIVSSRSGITSSQLKEMSNAGMDIESHTQTHQDLIKLTDSNELTREISGSKYSLSSTTKSTVISIAYPGCTANSTTIKYVKSAGYLLGFSCSKKIDQKYGGRYTLNRIHVYSNLENFKERLSGICNYTVLFE